MTRPSQSAALSDLISTVEELFPENTVARSPLSKGRSTFQLVPGTRKPRMLVPAGNSHAAARSLVRPSAADNFRNAVPRQLLSRLLSTKAGQWAMPHGLSLEQLPTAPDSIADYLCAVVGEPVVLSLTVGSARANRKPILNVHTEDGREIGFAKVGLSDLTNQLVHHEGLTLGKFHARESSALTVPRRIHSGLWNGHEVLLITALRPDIAQRRSHFPTTAAAAVARSSGIEFRQIATSLWLSTLEAAVSPLLAGSASRLPALLDLFRAKFGEVELPFGAWHGDFGPWNLAHTSGAPMIWDWERYDEHVPVGMDVIHYISHRDLRKTGAYAQARRSLEAQALPGLRQFILHTTGARTITPEQLQATLVGYLLTIAVRFTTDGLTPEGRPVRALARWHQDLAFEQMSRDVTQGTHEK